MSDLLRQLPHRPPFLFVSEVLRRDGATIEAAWQVTGEETFFAGHFPNDPLVPGVLLIEAMAQTAGLVLIVEGSRSQHAGMLVQSEIRFRAPVRPPARIVLTASTAGGLGQLHRFDVAARHDGRVVAEGSLILAVQSADDRAAVERDGLER